MSDNGRKISSGRFTRAAIHCEAGEVEMRLSSAGNWQLAIRAEGESEWRLACSGDVTGARWMPGAEPERKALSLGPFGP